jgi:hypothetical protein
MGANMLGQRLPDPKVVARAMVDKRRLISERLERARAVGDRIQAQELQALLKRLDRDIESYGLTFHKPVE